jgi:hypothetical protein
MTDDGTRTLPEAEDQIERLNSRIVELLRERDVLVKALNQIEDGHFSEASSLAVEGNWKRMYEALQQIARCALELGAKT